MILIVLLPVTKGVGNLTKMFCHVKRRMSCTLRRKLFKFVHVFYSVSPCRREVLRYVNSSVYFCSLTQYTSTASRANFMKAKSILRAKPTLRIPVRPRFETLSPCGQHSLLFLLPTMYLALSYLVDGLERKMKLHL